MLFYVVDPVDDYAVQQLEIVRWEEVDVCHQIGFHRRHKEERHAVLHVADPIKGTLCSSQRHAAFHRADPIEG